VVQLSPCRSRALSLARGGKFLLLVGGKRWQGRKASRVCIGDEQRIDARKDMGRPGAGSALPGACGEQTKRRRSGIQVHARRRTSNETAVCVVPSWARAVAPLDYSTALLCRDVHQRGSVPRSVLVRAPSSCKPRYETAAEPVINGPVWRSSASPVELFFRK
jgi:hypothetical protein